MGNPGDYPSPPRSPSLPNQWHCFRRSRSSLALPLPLPLPLPQLQQHNTFSSLQVKLRRAMRWGGGGENIPTENKIFLCPPVQSHCLRGPKQWCLGSTPISAAQVQGKSRGSQAEQEGAGQACSPRTETGATAPPNMDPQKLGN